MSHSAKNSPIRARALLLGLLGCIPASYATANLPQSSEWSLLVAPVGLLIVLASLNSAASAIFKGRVFTGGDLAAAFGMMFVAAAVSAEWTLYSHANMFQLPFLDGNPTVPEKILPNLPESLVAHKLEDVRDLTVTGLDWHYVWGRIAFFGPKILAWTAILGAVGFAGLCINNLLRHILVEKEKLSYPIIQLPMALTESGPTSVWKSRALWIAFGVMLAIDLLNGFNYLYPNLPKIAVRQVIDLAPFLREAPWSSIGDFNVGIYPFAAAVALFIPTDLLFSILVFFFLRKATHLVLGMNGIPQGTFSGTYFAPGPPYFEEQAWGAVIAIFIAAMYFSRAELKGIWRRIRSGETSDDGGVSDRWSFIGLALCVAGLVVFGTFGSIPPHLMLGFVLLFLVFSVVLTRIRAQVGPPTHEFAFFGPTGLFLRVGAFGGLPERAAVWLTQIFFFMSRISRTNPMPAQMESIKMAREHGQSPRRLFWALGLAMAAGVALAYWFSLVKAYRLGAPTGNQDSIAYLQNALNAPKQLDGTGIGMIGAGFGIAGALDLLRLRFPGFPLHPIGYVLGITYGVDTYWFGLALALAIKLAVQRYFGSGGFERLRQIAIGILLAEYLAEAIWMTVALVTKQSTYTIGFNDRSLGIQ